MNIFLVLALISFIIGIYPPAQIKINLISLGLALGVAFMLFG